ncbi:hypothetical protein R1sor_007323 [Riccia sorocarpa]|uniref:Reverse transcriptase domain-containing protein n=1 Tax=Riccia sorocarpa TaxID=122646 RepID=A0ABD3HTL9_9MARC
MYCTISGFDTRAILFGGEKADGLQEVPELYQGETEAFSKGTAGTTYGGTNQGSTVILAEVTAVRDPVDLPSRELLQYVSQLYYHPSAKPMPSAAEPVWVFLKDEVDFAVRSLRQGRAADLTGLTIEMIGFGGAALLEFVTGLLNQACTRGLPIKWAERKVVPIYKLGPKEDLKSYITIMRVLDVQNSLLTCCSSIDFSKAFDSVSQEQLWIWLRELNVPGELMNAVAVLYESVCVKVNRHGDGVSSTLGVIQGCPLSPTLFGLLIDKLYWQLGAELEEDGCFVLRTIQTFIFADDVVLFTRSEDQLLKQLEALQHFCNLSGMKVNISKTKWMCSGPRPTCDIIFQDSPVEECKVYKYLGIDVAASLSWAKCAKSRAASGTRALCCMRQRCRKAGLFSWALRFRLFAALVQAAVLYAVVIWGSALPVSSWNKVERVHKMFLQEEMGVRSQVPYTILLSESGRLPLEVEGLILTLKYVARVKSQNDNRYSHQAFIASHGQGWYADVCRWSARWGYPDEYWDFKNLREDVTRLAIRRLWENPTTRQSYYLRDITTLEPYSEKGYLSSDLAWDLRRIIAQFRTSSHTLGVETGRWHGLPRKQRTCTLCPMEKTESEYHNLLICPYFLDIQQTHGIDFSNLHHLFALPPLDLGHYLNAVNTARNSRLQPETRSAGN